MTASDIVTLLTARLATRPTPDLDSSLARNALLASLVSAVSGGALIVTPSTTLVAATCSLTDAVASSSVAAGASSITFENVGSANATITTPSASAVTVQPGQTPVVFVAPPGGKLPAIAYTASATAILRITVVVA